MSGLEEKKVVPGCHAPDRPKSSSIEASSVSSGSSSQPGKSVILTAAQAPEPAMHERMPGLPRTHRAEDVSDAAFSILHYLFWKFIARARRQEDWEKHS
jgi:hypothetical protein